MGLRRTREHVSPVQPHPQGYSFTMSPGVTIVIQPDENSTEMDWFARRLAETIQQVARNEWT